MDKARSSFLSLEDLCLKAPKKKTLDEKFVCVTGTQVHRISCALLFFRAWISRSLPPPSFREK